ncbi:MAG: carbohydrate kinase family protein [Candidatus Limnocylindrales bacterium]
MSTLRRITRVRSARPPRRARRPRVVVLGDLVLDVVLMPDGPLRRGTDVAGRVSIHQGGSAANAARWLARLGVPTQLIGSVGRDPAGRALVAALRSDGVTTRIARSGAARTGRIGVLVTKDGERSFVADRGAADLLAPDDLQATWFDRVDLVHLPAYSLLGEPLGLAGRRAVGLARSAGALVTLDLASAAPLLADGRRAALALVRAVAPDLVFATAGELGALIGPSGRGDIRAVDLAPIVVVKRGPGGVSVLIRDGGPSRFDVATRSILAADTTGAGDAFDAGFIAEWLASRAAGRSTNVALRRAAVAGNRVAARQVFLPRRELQLD